MMSSKPTTARSSGTFTPRSARIAITATASSSLAQTIASAGSDMPSSASTTAGSAPLDQRHEERERGLDGLLRAGECCPEAGVALGDVVGAGRVADEHQPSPTVLEQVVGELLGGVQVLHQHRVAPVDGLARQQHRRGGPADLPDEGVGDGVVGEDQAVDARQHLAYGLLEVDRRVREPEHDRLAVARGRRLEPDQQLGVVGTHHAGEDQSVRLVARHLDLAGRPQRDVVELLHGLEDLAARHGGRRRGAAQHPRHGRDRDAGAVRHGVDRDRAVRGVGAHGAQPRRACQRLPGDRA